MSDEAGISYDASVMQQDAKLARQRNRQDPAHLAQEEKIHRQTVLRTLNALRVIAPALRQAVNQGETEEAQSALFVKTLGAAREFAEEVAQTMDLDPSQERNRWAVGMLERAYMEAGEGQPLAWGKALQKVSLQAAEERGQESQVPAFLDDQNAALLALVRALPPVIRAQAEFNYFRPDAQQDLLQMGQLIVDVATQLTLRTVDPLTPSHDRQVLFVALVEEGGRVLADSWNHLAKVAQRMARGRTQAEMESWRRAKPEGLPLEQVEARFRQQMATLGQLLKATHKRR